VLQSETWILSGGDHRWFERSTRKKRHATRYNDKITTTIMMIIIIIKLIIIIITIIIIMGRLGPFPNHSENTWATYQETMTLRNYRKQPYWALHTYFGKC
jgi:heme/copper-type cytochrome/quinol oxidase subunit 2